MQAFHGFVHILHEEGVVEVFQAGAEKTAGLFERLYAALDQQVCQDPVYTQFGRQLRSLFRIRGRNQTPLTFRNSHLLHAHALIFIYDTTNLLSVRG